VLTLLACRNHPSPQQKSLRLLEIEAVLPVIAVAARGGCESAVRAMKAEVVDFIEKTCRDEALIGAIESAMQRGTRTYRGARTPEAAARIAVGLAPNNGQQRRRDNRLLSPVCPPLPLL
jgi:FixJ family two-component response regulator